MIPSRASLLGAKLYAGQGFGICKSGSTPGAWSVVAIPPIVWKVEGPVNKAASTSTESAPNLVGSVSSIAPGLRLSFVNVAAGAVLGSAERAGYTCPSEARANDDVVRSDEM